MEIIHNFIFGAAVICPPCIFTLLVLFDFSSQASNMLVLTINSWISNILSERNFHIIFFLQLSMNQSQWVSSPMGICIINPKAEAVLCSGMSEGPSQHLSDNRNFSPLCLKLEFDLGKY